MRYAEVAFMDRSDEKVRVLLRFNTREERDKTAYDFLRFYDGSRETYFVDLSRAEARSRYDLRRFDIPRYRVEVTIYDNNPTGTREIYGIYETWYEKQLQARAAVRFGQQRYMQPVITLDDLFSDLKKSEGEK